MRNRIVLRYAYDFLRALVRKQQVQASRRTEIDDADVRWEIDREMKLYFVSGLKGGANRHERRHSVAPQFDANLRAGSSSSLFRSFLCVTGIGQIHIFCLRVFLNRL